MIIFQKLCSSGGLSSGIMCTVIRSGWKKNRVTIGANESCTELTKKNCSKQERFFYFMVQYVIFCDTM